VLQGGEGCEVPEGETGAGGCAGERETREAAPTADGGRRPGGPQEVRSFYTLWIKMEGV